MNVIMVDYRKKENSKWCADLVRRGIQKHGSMAETLSYHADTFPKAGRKYNTQAEFVLVTYRKAWAYRHVWKLGYPTNAHWWNP